VPRSQRDTLEPLNRTITRCFLALLKNRVWSSSLNNFISPRHAEKLSEKNSIAAHLSPHFKK
jgi:hypothetical protein